MLHMRFILCCFTTYYYLLVHIDVTVLVIDSEGRSPASVEY